MAQRSFALILLKDASTEFKGSSMPTITIVDRQGHALEFEVASGLSVLEIARMKSVDIEGRCEGSLACSTCHVLLDAESCRKLPAASEEEQDMLDTVATGLTATSRLGCQVRVTESLSGMVVTLPKPRSH
jgi:ferredoxin, 2Fe-2S